MHLLDLAPHASLPPKDGADKRSWHLYEELVKGGTTGAFIGRTLSVRGLGSPQAHSPARSWRDRKFLTALAACLGRRDYRQLKHLLPGAREAIAAVETESFEALLVNFLFAMPLARAFLDQPIRLLVDTQNYDPGWYRSMAAASKNPLFRQLCRNGARDCERTLRTLPDGTVLVHVSEADANLYRRHRPDLAHIIIENGASIRPRRTRPDYTRAGKKQLLFVGSLSAKMNQDALRYFAARFWPRLREGADFCVVGSNPPAEVGRLCGACNWSLQADVAQEQLERLYEQAHFAVLPFEYGEGSKLKFLEACGRGVPVLATSAGLCGMPRYPQLVTASDDAAVWARAVEQRSEPEAEKTRRLIEFAEAYSWKNLAGKLLMALESAPVLHANSHYHESLRP